MKTAKKPFKFYTSSLLVEITGKRASHLKEFVEILKTIDESSIFHHIHHSYREFHFVQGGFTNDFARWIDEDLEEYTLAERLMAIDIRDFVDLGCLRKHIIDIVVDYLDKAVEIKKVTPGREFYFNRSIEIIMPTPYKAETLKEFAQALKKVGMRSLYYHFFDAQLRLGKKTNDFSEWMRDSLDDEARANQIEKIDPYLLTMDELRDKIISLCSEKQPFWKGIFKWRA